MSKILQNYYVLAVHDMRVCARIFVDVLDFEIVNEPAGWIFVKKDNCMVMLGECPDDMHPSTLGCHNYFGYLRVDDVDAYHARATRQGAGDWPAPVDKPWGMRKFAVKTPEGHRITIGHMIETREG